MPRNYFENVQILEKELCATHISSILECSHYIAANQIIMECLMERVTSKVDILDLCELLSLFKNATHLASILDNLRASKCRSFTLDMLLYIHISLFVVCSFSAYL